MEVPHVVQHSAHYTIASYKVTDVIFSELGRYIEERFMQCVLDIEGNITYSGLDYFIDEDIKDLI